MGQQPTTASEVTLDAVHVLEPPCSLGSSHGMRVGADNLGPVALNVGSVAVNVGRRAAPAYLIWAGTRDDLAPKRG
jgi:hypothetical protein